MSDENNGAPDFGYKNFDGRRRKVMPLPADRAKRQGLIVRLALSLLGGRDKAMNFLNAHDPELDARPLDVATKDAAGYTRVEDLMRRMLAAPPEN